MEDKNIGFELITLGHVLKRKRDRMNEKAKDKVLGPDSNVPCSDINILKFLLDNKNTEIYQKDIERFLSLTAPSVSNKLRELERKELITRTYSKIDTRLKRVTLTTKAINVLGLITKEIAEFENNINDLLNDKEKLNLMNVIDKLKNHYE